MTRDPVDTEQELRNLLLIGYDYSYRHDDWVEPLEEALKGVTAEQAAWRPGDGLMGIWDIALHLTVWNDNIIERIETGKPARPAEGHWPAKPEIPSEAAWGEAREALLLSAGRLREYIETVPFDRVRASPWGFGDLICRFNHMAYHIGQIVKIRECNGW